MKEDKNNQLADQAIFFTSDTQQDVKEIRTTSMSLTVGTYIKVVENSEENEDDFDHCTYPEISSDHSEYDTWLG